MYRAAIVGRADVRRGAGAAVEIDAADRLPRKEYPGVVGGVVGVLERNAVVRDGIFAVDKTAECGVALPQSDAVGADAEGTWNDLHEFRKVGNRRCEVVDEVTGNHGPGRTCIE